MWHVGILYRASDFLAVVAKHSLYANEIKVHFPTYHGVKTDELMNVLLAGHWVIKDENGRIILSNQGQKLLQLPTLKAKLRAQVQKLMDVLKPSWGVLTIQGRQAFEDYAPQESVQCFREAGLLDGFDDEALVWWDRTAIRYRQEQDAQKIFTGRKGEKKSYDYEFARTGHPPYWIALHYEGAGYDICSQSSDLDDSPFLIEVKATSNMWERGIFFLTRHEWEVLSNNDRSALHLWSFANHSDLFALVPISEIEQHIPSDKGSGQWSVVSLSFSNFRPTKVSAF